MALVGILTRSLWSTAFVVAALTIVAVLAGVAFRLTWGGAVALYFVVWWTALFAVLPISIRTQAEQGDVAPGSDPGAPAAPHLRARAIWTSLVSTIVFIAVAAFFPLAGL